MHCLYFIYARTHDKNYATVEIHPNKPEADGVLVLSAFSPSVIRFTRI